MDENRNLGEKYTQKINKIRSVIFNHYHLLINAIQKNQSLQQQAENQTTQIGELEKNIHELVVIHTNLQSKKGNLINEQNNNRFQFQEKREKQLKIIDNLLEQNSNI
ncbi:hypothetical protein M0813_22063 [Anaeramoeba flamelloides]|uniref:Uncharacterized protein n=1 Tax=Anaeramoeba flamelloides TaxID=1746091 RepID=A0ABQ8YGB0_9EUKA|nr:hypothetical protein M0813_22063 [Anaeramoeba flamelloides]